MDKFCPKCKSKVLGGKFCGNCGAVLTKLDEDETDGDIFSALDKAIVGITDVHNAKQSEDSKLRLLLVRGQYDEAKKYCNEIIDKDPRNVSGYIGLIRIASKNYKEFESAEIAEQIRIADAMIDKQELFADVDYKNYINARNQYFEEKERKERERKFIEANFEIVNGILKWYKGAGENVVIPNIVTTIGSSAFSRCKTVKEIEISDSVTTIESNPFGHCSELVRITVSSENNHFKGENNCLLSKDGSTLILGCRSSIIPNTVKKIAAYAFEGCRGLTNLFIPSSVTSIAENAFIGCNRLERITVDEKNVNYRSVNNCIISKDGKILLLGCKSSVIPNGIMIIGNNAFSDCRGLISLIMPNGIKTIGENAFKGCNLLTSITIPNGVESIGSSAFEGCNELKSITIPDSVESIGEGAFSGCKKLYLVDEGVWYVDKWVVDCDNVSKIVLKDGTKGIVDNVLYYECDEITSITIPQGVAGICPESFDECSKLENIIFKGTAEQLYQLLNFEELERHLNYNFWCNEGVILFRCTDIDIKFYHGTSGVWFEYVPHDIKDFEIEKGVLKKYRGKSPSVFVPSSVKSIGEGAFSYRRNITSITIPNSVTSIGERAFADCSGLTSITIPKSVTHIGAWAFGDCSGLRIYCEAAIKPSRWSDNWNYRHAYRYEDSCFPVVWDCKNNDMDDNGYIYIVADGLRYSLKGGEATISGVLGEISGAIDINAKVFYKNTEYSVTCIGSGAFRGCSALTSVIIPDSVTTIGAWAFEGCSGLTSVTIPNYLTSIEVGTFEECSRLKSITIPNSVAIINNAAFRGCSGLTSMIIPYSVFEICALTTIGAWAFDDSGLTSVTIPKGCKYTKFGKERSFPRGCKIRKQKR